MSQHSGSPRASAWQVWHRVGGVFTKRAAQISSQIVGSTRSRLQFGWERHWYAHAGERPQSNS